jgi:ParB/RepB/Spo0J family partition protein
MSTSTSTAPARFTVPLHTINDSNRIRKDYGDIDELAKSISTLGLLQPIVIRLDGTLIAGGRRLRAMRKLGWTDIPVTYFEVADDVTLRILEVEENVRRKAMSWQERVLAIADVHAKQSLHKILSGERWSQQATGELLGMSSANISYSLELATYIRAGDKEIDKCDRMWDALNLLIKRKAEESNKLLAKMTLPSLTPEQAKAMLTEAKLDDTDVFASVGGPSSGSVAQLQDDGEMPGAGPTGDVMLIPLSKMVLKGDCLQVMSQLDADCVDHIITDPPYAIDMENIDQANDGKSVASTAAEHEVLPNLNLLDAFVSQAFRTLKPAGFCIMWTDMMTFQYLYDRCIGVGFKVQRWPLIWHKTHRCMNQMALYNFTKDYEIAIVCRKGNATLLTPQSSSVYMGATDEGTRQLGHPFAKPAKLWQWLYSAVAHKGQLVLDPFSGVGSSTLAAIEFGLQPLAIEVNEKHHAAQVVNVAEHYRKTLRNVKFL